MPACSGSRSVVLTRNRPWLGKLHAQPCWRSRSGQLSPCSTPAAHYLRERASRSPNTSCGLLCRMVQKERWRGRAVPYLQPNEIEGTQGATAMDRTNGGNDRNSHSETPRLRIAQIAPLYERIPPKLYGGTERVVSYITEELVRRGHQVTLFASGDSLTAAKLVPGCPQSLRLIGKPELGAFLQLPMLSDVYEGAASRFDIIHSHIDYWSFPFARLTKVPTVATMHGRLDVEELHPVYARYRGIPLVSISDAQRKPLSFMNWVET